MRLRFTEASSQCKNKAELYIALFVMLIFGVARFSPTFDAYLFLAGGMVFSLVCCFNALLDFRRMNIFERLVAILIFCFLLFATPLVIWHLVSGPWPFSIPFYRENR